MPEKEPLKIKGSMDDVLRVLLTTPPKKVVKKASKKLAKPKK